MRLRTLLAGALLAVAVPAAAEETRLVILHTTDLHGSLTGWDYLTDRAAPRGLVKIASLVDSARDSPKRLKFGPSRWSKSAADRSCGTS